MSANFLYTIEVIINGLMAGVLYSLVALGFVLIFKASGIFNYAQGVMALFAALTLVGLQEGRVPFAHLINAMFGTKIHHFDWSLPALLAIILTVLIMILFAILVEKLILKHLVNQEPIILFMATIGLAYFMEGFGDLMWGSDVKTLNVGIPQGGSFWFEDFTIGWAAEGEKFYGMYVDLLDVCAATLYFGHCYGPFFGALYESVVAGGCWFWQNGCCIGFVVSGGSVWICWRDYGSYANFGRATLC